MTYIDQVKDLIQRLKDLILDFEHRKLDDLEEFEQQRISSAVLKSRESSNNEIIQDTRKKIRELENEIKELSDSNFAPTNTLPEKTLADAKATIEVLEQELLEKRTDSSDVIITGYAENIPNDGYDVAVKEFLLRVRSLSVDQLYTILTVLTMNENRVIVAKKALLTTDIEEIITKKPEMLNIAQVVMSELKM